MNPVSLLVMLVVCSLAVAGCRSATGRSFGQQIDDKVISSQVKMKLTSGRAGSLFSTGVGTHLGVVRLTGTVETAEQRAQAESIAAQTPGVRSVVNDIVVAGSSVTTRESGERVSIDTDSAR
jgi:hyperosmotically inducible periplasmic protein